MKLSVAICTWNRARLLDQTLASFRELRIPAGVTWEILVVDNNCADDTQDVLKRHAANLPVVALHESKQGQSHARNRAIDAATGDVIVWTDDDVRPDADWLANYAAAFERHPDAAFFGGRIEPWYESPPPNWVAANERRLEGMLVIRDLGPDERPFRVSHDRLTRSETPFGANMAVRAAAQREHRYDPHLGKVKNSNVTADETDLFARIRAAGGHGVWVPSASVRHFVMSSRMTTKYLWSYHHGQGQSEVRTNTFDLPWDTPVFRNAPRWVFKKRIEAGLKAWGQWLAGNPAWAVSYAKAAKFAGMIDEFHATRWAPPPKPVPVVSGERVRTNEAVPS